MTWCAVVHARKAPSHRNSNWIWHRNFAQIICNAYHNVQMIMMIIIIIIIDMNSGQLISIIAIWRCYIMPSTITFLASVVANLNWPKNVIYDLGGKCSGTRCNLRIGTWLWSLWLVYILYMFACSYLVALLIIFSLPNT